jgi:endonuclease/exonuclease/phosphatase family metal-dependent hydrolase
MILLTWNMQGGGSWDSVNSLIAKYGVNILCLQECGIPPKNVLQDKAKDDGGIPVLYNVGSNSKPHIFSGLYFEYGKVNKRCSLMVLADNATGHSGVKKVTYQGKSKGILGDKLRPAVGIQTAAKLWAFSFHAPSKNHSFASACTKSVICDLVGQKDIDNWVIGGDFNCEPKEMEKRLGAPGYICNGGKPTQKSGNELDYAIHTNGLKIKCLGAQGTMSDHYPVFFEL